MTDIPFGWDTALVFFGTLSAIGLAGLLVNLLLDRPDGEEEARRRWREWSESFEANRATYPDLYAPGGGGHFCSNCRHRSDYVTRGMEFHQCGLTGNDVCMAYGCDDWETMPDELKRLD